MRRTLVLIASTALLLPTAVLAAPADAAQSATPTITNCVKAKHGVTVRIRIRDEGRFMRIRVSHPRGEGKFREPRVRWTATGVTRESKAVPPDENGNEIGSAISMDRARNEPAFRTGPAWYRTSVTGTFKLRNGKSIRLGCTVR